MRAPGIVVADPRRQPGAQLRAGLERVQVYTFILQAAPKPLDKHIIHPPAPSVHGNTHTGLPQNTRKARRRKPAPLVGVEDFGPAKPGKRFLECVNAELNVHRVRYTPRQHLAGRPVHHRNQIEEAAPHRYIRDVRTQHLIRTIDHHLPQQIRVDLVLGMRNRCPWPLVNRHQPHPGHQPPDALAADRIALAPQMARHLARAIPGRLPGRLVVEPGPADRNQFTLPHHRQLGVPGLNHLPPPLDAHRPEAFAKKSRSTTNCPILACSFSTSASDDFAVSCAADRSANTAVSPSMACFFHSPTIVWWMLCLVANCAVVSSPRSASRATFALKSAEYRFRLPVIPVRPSQEQTELKPMS